MKKQQPIQQRKISPLLDLIDKDTTKTKESNTREEFNSQNPLFGMLNPRGHTAGTTTAFMYGWFWPVFKDTARINGYLKLNQVRALFPRDS